MAPELRDLDRSYVLRETVAHSSCDHPPKITEGRGGEYSIGMAAFDKVAVTKCLRGQAEIGTMDA
jgi:hypothetical protein